MLYVFAAGALKRLELAPGAALPPGPIWVDMLRPTPEEERAVESALGIEAPTREEMQEIEVSSRLYQENGAHYMTAAVLIKADTPHPESAAVTFILKGNCLVTLRYTEPHAFRAFALQAERHPDLFGSGQAILLGLLDAVIDRTADILERVGNSLDLLSREIFRGSPPTGKASGRDFPELLRSVGHDGDLTSRARESLVGIGRLVSFLAATGDAKKDVRTRLRTLSRDVLSLSDHASFLSSKVNFLLDATLGMINIEQNNIIKIFSVAAVVFLPPTLIASIYGMNFHMLPELSWPWGYPFALLLMLISAVLPYIYFKRRGWL